MLLSFKISDNSSSTSGIYKFYYIDNCIWSIIGLLAYLESEYNAGAQIELGMLEDEELKKKISNLIYSSDNLDTIIREVTTILEDRIREKAGLDDSFHSISLIDEALHCKKGKLIISDNEDVRRGIYELCCGLFRVFRNESHHKILDDIKKENVLKIVMVIDEILLIINNSKKNEPTTTAATNPNQGE